MEALTAEITDLIAAQNWSGLRDAVLRWPPAEVADLLFSLPQAERVILFRLLPRPIAGEVFAHLSRQAQTHLLEDLTSEETSRVLADLRPDDRTHVLEDLPGPVVQKMLNLLDPMRLRQARELLNYPEESVGRLMTPDYVAVRPEWTIADALAHLRRKAKSSETISVVYVIEAGWRLVDALELQQFVLADPAQRVREIMDSQFVTLSPRDDREEAVRVMVRHGLFAVPVVDEDGVLLGIVTMDDALVVAEEEATEDIQRVAAVTPLKTSYREASIWMLYRKRVPWLATLILVNLAASGVMAAYEETLASAIALTFFVPLLLGSGGNAGAQSATLMVRAMATGDVGAGQWLGSLVKEIAVGGGLGATMGLLAYVLGMARGGPSIGLTVAVSMLAIITVANLIGVSLPFLLARMRIDPAVASNPMITSLADVTGLAIYLGVASRVLPAVGAG